ncbi:MAG: hypothetical protein HYS37_08865 [Candidatus Rokubacteria bacterium]|nr:hypothetical protein [Candidatus Rokubacteria bacterium]
MADEGARLVAERELVEERLAIDALEQVEAALGTRVTGERGAAAELVC